MCSDPSEKIIIKTQLIMHWSGRFYAVAAILCIAAFIENGSASNITAVASSKWSAIFKPNNITVHMHHSQSINLTLYDLDTNDLIDNNATIRLASDSDILQVSRRIPLHEIEDGEWWGSFNVSAVFLGTARVHVIIEMNGKSVWSRQSLPVIIIREERFIDKLFTISVATLVSILYINFGAALDLTKVKEILVRPIGPAIAFFCQFLFLPLMSYALGLLLFPNNVEMQLGMFFTGVSPSGGASNIWCVILGGNLDLSIAMTTISTFSAFAMMPLWIFTLGRSIFDRGNLMIPYARIASFAIALIIPLGIGLLLQRYLPRVAKVLVRILKSFSSLLILFIVIFAIVTNLYLFQLFTWQIIVAGLGLPWLSYLVGWAISVFFQREYEDRLAIAIEAGIQNTGIAIFILRFALGQPQADLTTVVPVSVAIMTPFPLMGYYLCIKIRECMRRRGKKAVPNEANDE